MQNKGKFKFGMKDRRYNAS